MRKPRLSVEKWIAAGLDVLAVEGPQALAAEPLAKRLCTTKGSFYWHFPDLPTFQEAVIGVWRHAALADLSERLAGSGAPDQRLRALCLHIRSDRTEAAMRTWSQQDERVCEALEELDAARLSFVSLLLREIGLANKDFAVALLAAVAGLSYFPAQSSIDREAALDTLIDTVLALAD